MLYKILQIFSGSSHLIYGILVMVDPFYNQEFIRYGFSDYQILIAGTQALAGFGLILGFYKRGFIKYCSAILAIMMIGALLTRIVIQDDMIQSSPAILYMLVNSTIFIQSINTRK